MKLTRRHVVMGLVSLGGAGVLERHFAFAVRASDATAAAPLYVPEVQRTLEAALDRVLPGCVAAGVMDHFAWWVRHDRFFSGVKREFEVGAGWLDRLALGSHQRAFAKCDGAQQDAVLRRVQQGQVKVEGGFDGELFFQHLVAIALEGFLSDPKYGGNKGLAGWNFIGKSHCWWSPKRVDRLLKPDEGFVD